jgi:hypothetical protein
MSEEKLKTSRSLKKEGFSVPMQVPTNSKVMNDTITKLPEDPEASVNMADKGFTTDPNFELRQMFSVFLESNQEERARNRQEISELRSIVTSLKESSGESHSSDTVQVPMTPFPNRSRENRRSSAIFFGSPNAYVDSDNDSNSNAKTNHIQVLQADIIYDKELKVVSLEGLQYLAKQLALLANKYPGREIRTPHMVHYNLRPHVVASWNTHCYQESLVTGKEPQEILVEDWLSLSNRKVQDMLVQCARPRTRELYSRELILFLGKGIPQSPEINTDNFSKIFFGPLTKSLHDLQHLHDLLSEETSNISTNKAKMPVTSYGTKDSPGHIALWILSLGSQKEALLQWLGKDELQKHKTLEPCIKYIRVKLNEARSQSEARHDLDAKLTPVRYEEIRATQGESFTRHQVTSQVRTASKQPDNNTKFRPRYSLTAIDQTYDQEFDSVNDHMPTEDEDEHCEDVDDLDNDNPAYSEEYDSTNYIDTKRKDNYSLQAITEPITFRSAMAATFRGYCSELFVFGKCSKRDATCSFDHSAAGQERCIESFTLLAKRETLRHGQLPPYTPKDTPGRPRPSPSSQLQRQFPNTHVKSGYSGPNTPLRSYTK